MGERGAIDFLVSFEILEAARFIEWLKPDGRIVTNTQKLIPMSVSSGGFSYPADDEIRTTLESRTEKILYVNALGKAQALGNVRLTNTIVLGALSTHLDLAPELWLDVIERRVPPRYADLNRQAFEEGRQAAN
jgi:indolepyruvate ferredoxin oxidoreductase beta subunit